MYIQRVRRNLRPIIEGQGIKIFPKYTFLESISPRHFWNVEKGLAQISLEKLEAIADEIGVDMLEFFRE